MIIIILTLRNPALQHTANLKILWTNIHMQTFTYLYLQRFQFLISSTILLYPRHTKRLFLYLSVTSQLLVFTPSQRQRLPWLWTINLQWRVQMHHFLQLIQAQPPIQMHHHPPLQAYDHLLVDYQNVDSLEQP